MFIIQHLLVFLIWSEKQLQNQEIRIDFHFIHLGSLSSLRVVQVVNMSYSFFGHFQFFGVQIQDVQAKLSQPIGSYLALKKGCGSFQNHFDSLAISFDSVFVNVYKGRSILVPILPKITVR